MLVFTLNKFSNIATLTRRHFFIVTTNDLKFSDNTIFNKSFQMMYHTAAFVICFFFFSKCPAPIFNVSSMQLRSTR